MTGEIKRKLKGREAKNTQTSKRAPPREQVPLPVPDLGAAGSGLRFQRCVSVFGLVSSLSQVTKTMGNTEGPCFAFLPNRCSNGKTLAPILYTAAGERANAKGSWHWHGLS
jgi:hypothetical protein